MHSYLRPPDEIKMKKTFSTGEAFFRREANEGHCSKLYKIFSNYLDEGHVGD